MFNECTGYWENCQCPDCTLVAELYDELYWLELNCPEDIEGIQALMDEIEGMGYSI